MVSRQAVESEMAFRRQRRAAVRRAKWALLEWKWKGAALASSPRFYVGLAVLLGLLCAGYVWYWETVFAARRAEQQSQWGVYAPIGNAD